MTGLPLATSIAVIACAAAAIFDLRTRRISNWLTGGLAVAALGIHAASGWASLGWTLLLLGVATALGGLVYGFGGIGGGDVKLAIAASAMLGFPVCIAFLLYSAVAGGLQAAGVAVFQGGIGALVARDKTAKMPYGAAFACGAIVVALSQTVAPFLRISL